MTSETEPRVSYLMGAGASVDAGLPVSVDLTEEIVKSIGAPNGRNAVAQALHSAIGAIIAHDTAKGKSAYDGIDVERIFAAIRMLGRRDDHELTPFVGSWNPAVDSLPSRATLPSFWASDMRKGLDGSSSFKLEQSFISGVKAITNPLNSTGVYQQLEKLMIKALASCLVVLPDRVDYLRPLFQIGDHPVRIATLNYDNSVEMAAQSEGIELDTGIHAWAGGYRWQWSTTAQANLLKLHGSLDWHLTMSPAEGQNIATDRVLAGEDVNDNDKIGSNLGVVFGQGSKLRADGPFLAMLVEFDNFLASTDHLIITGYSFRDDHINSALRRWVAGNPDCCLTIIDPYIPEVRNMHGLGFRSELVQAFCLREENGRYIKHPLEPSERLNIIKKKATEGLQEALMTRLI